MISSSGAPGWYWSIGHVVSVDPMHKKIGAIEVKKSIGARNGDEIAGHADNEDMVSNANLLDLESQGYAISKKPLAGRLLTKDMQRSLGSLHRQLLKAALPAVAARDLFSEIRSVEKQLQGRNASSFSNITNFNYK